jgi:hypothetical protein
MYAICSVVVFYLPPPKDGFSELAMGIMAMGAGTALTIAMNEIITAINKKRVGGGNQPLSQASIASLQASPTFLLLVIKHLYGKWFNNEPISALLALYFIKEFVDLNYISITSGTICIC